MQALRVLYLNNNELTGTTLDLHNPYTICIAYIPLSTRYTVGAIPADIDKLTGVTALNFDENKLAGWYLRQLLRIIVIPTSRYISYTLPCHMCICSCVEPIPESLRFLHPGLDKTILIEFYHATNGPEWSTSWSWCSDEPLHLWSGVTVQNERVTLLNLSGNGLKGESLKMLTLCIYM